MGQKSMKTIGLLGGMSWESTSRYYREINEGVKAALGGLHSARIVLHSVDFDPIEKMQSSGDWQGAAELLVPAARGIEAAGADFLLLCTNTMHKIAPRLEAAVGIPFLHIADATAQALAKDSVNTVGLLGTRFTMEQDFYRGRLTDLHGLTVVVPDEEDRKIVDDVIFQELCLGKILDESKAKYLDIVGKLAAAGAEAIILGCTEISMLINQTDTQTPLYDTTEIHAACAVAKAL